MLRHSAKSSAGYRGLLALGFASPWLAADDGYHSDTTSGSTWATRFWSGGQNSTTTEASSGYGSDSSDNSDVVSTV